MENFSQKVKSLKRFCPNCHTQEIINSMRCGDEIFICTWCDDIFNLNDLVTFHEIRNKKIEEILS
jgi:ribosomal protein S27AE